jgi:hypothetical protein
MCFLFSFVCLPFRKGAGYILQYYFFAYKKFDYLIFIEKKTRFDSFLFYVVWE